MEQKRLDEVVEALTKKGVKLPCPRCNNAKLEFDVVGESLIPIQEDPDVSSRDQAFIPVIIVACLNCGYITQHAAAPLGIMRGGG